MFAIPPRDPLGDLVDKVSAAISAWRRGTFSLGNELSRVPYDIGPVMDEELLTHITIS